MKYSLLAKVSVALTILMNLTQFKNAVCLTDACTILNKKGTMPCTQAFFDVGSTCLLLIVHQNIVKIKYLNMFL